MTSPTILIVGGGIGGLTTAIALRQMGFTPRIVEQATAQNEVGAGITLQANASAVLEALGVTFAPDDVCPLEQATVVSSNGKVLLQLAASEMNLPHPAVNVHRADLQATLLHKLEELGGRLEWGRRVVVLRDLSSHVEVLFEDGETLRCDLVIGADGINSTVRRSLFGSTGSRYSGQTCWRFAASVSDASALQSIERWAPGRRVGLVPLSRGRVYGYLVQSAPPGTPSEHTRTVAHLVEIFGGMDATLDSILKQLVAREAAGETIPVHHGDLRDQPHISFGRGRVLLVGDAAHATTPNLGQGAGMAIEDAGLVAIALASGGVELDRLHDHLDGVHRHRVKQVQTRSWRIGAVAHWQHPIGCFLRDLGLSMMPASTSVKQARELYAPGLELAQELAATVALREA